MVTSNYYRGRALVWVFNGEYSLVEK